MALLATTDVDAVDALAQTISQLSKT